MFRLFPHLVPSDEQKQSGSRQILGSQGGALFIRIKDISFFFSSQKPVRIFCDRADIFVTSIATVKIAITKEVPDKFFS